MTCRHLWMIESPNGPTSMGKCKKCKETREFRNTPADLTFKDRSQTSDGPRRSRRMSDIAITKSEPTRVL